MCLVFDVQTQALEMISVRLIISLRAKHQRTHRVEGSCIASNSAKTGICNVIGPNPQTELRVALESQAKRGVAAIGASDWAWETLFRLSTPLASRHTLPPGCR